MSRQAEIIFTFKQEPSSDRIVELRRSIGNRMNEAADHKTIIPCKHKYELKHGGICFPEEVFFDYRGTLLYEYNLCNRIWSESNPEGFFLLHMSIMMVLLNQEDINQVWYLEVDEFSYGGNHVIQPMDEKKIWKIFKAYIKQGIDDDYLDYANGVKNEKNHPFEGL